MKKTLIILLALGMSSAASASFYIAPSTIGLLSAKKAVMASNSISHFMGKKLLVKSHMLKNIPVTHQNGDYLQLKADGTFTKVFNGVTENGNYAYNQGDATLKLVGDETKVFNVSDITQSSLKLANNVEVIELKLLQISKPQLRPKK